MTGPAVRTIEAASLSSADNYRLMIGSIVPRPIAWVSSLSADGIPNLAPFSFFLGLTSSPPLLGFSAIHQATGPKDTRRNIAETGEFVVNVVNEAVGEAMNATSQSFPPEVDEFVAAGLTPAPSRLVRPARVAEAPIQMECRLERLVDLGGSAAGGVTRPATTTLVIGEIVVWHIREDLFDAERKRVRIDRLQAIGRLAGDWYTRTRDQFEMVRPDPNYRGR